MLQVRTRKDLIFIQMTCSLMILKILLHKQKKISQRRKIIVHQPKSRCISLLQELSKGQAKNTKIKSTAKNYCSGLNSPRHNSISKKYKSNKVSPHVIKRSIDLTDKNNFSRILMKVSKQAQNENTSPLCVKVGSKKIIKSNQQEGNLIAEYPTKKVFDGKDTLNCISQDKTKRRYRVDRIKLSENNQLAIDVYIKPTDCKKKKKGGYSNNISIKHSNDYKMKIKNHKRECDGQESLFNEQCNIEPYENEEHCNQIPESAFDVNLKMKNLKGIKINKKLSHSKSIQNLGYGFKPITINYQI